jgi:hypothetical protein
VFVIHPESSKVANWMKTQDRYGDVLTRLEHACMFLNDRARIMENRNHVRRCKQASESQLLEEGKLMTEQELRQFYEDILGDIDRLVAQCNAGALEEGEAGDFQRLLMTLLLFTIGGQRKEVIMGLTIQVIRAVCGAVLTSDKNVVFDRLRNCYLIKLEAEKVLRTINSEGLVLPLYLGELIGYFIKNVRKLLRPQTGILGLWIVPNNGAVVGESSCRIDR